MLLSRVDMVDFSPGEAGGVFAGVVAGFAMVGKALAWLLNWNDARTGDREARLKAWETSLTDRERAYREKIEDELRKVESEVDQLRAVLLELAAELHRHVPESPALSRAVRFLNQLAKDTTA